VVLLLFSALHPLSPLSLPFPYTTLFRSIAVLTFILYFAWLYFYDYYVFHGIHEHDWYLLDRIFISFFIYGVYGVLAWQLRSYYRSEEHTSELQSRFDLVCRLLLEKKR